MALPKRNKLKHSLPEARWVYVTPRESIEHFTKFAGVVRDRRLDVSPLARYLSYV